jgi:hypothetical protein
MKPSAIPPPRPRPDAAPMDGRSRRVDVRVAVRAVLRPLANGADAGPEIYGWVGNLSTGGAWVRAVEPLPPETFCEVRLVWKDGGVFRAVFLKGWVVYGSAAGMGLQFEAVSSELKEVLHRLDHTRVAPAA